MALFSESFCHGARRCFRDNIEKLVGGNDVARISAQPTPSHPAGQSCRLAPDPKPSSAIFPTPATGAVNQFHGRNGVVPLEGRSSASDETRVTENSERGFQLDTLAAKAAKILLLSELRTWEPSSGSDCLLIEKSHKQNKRASNYELISQVEGVKGLIEEVSPSYGRRGVMELEERFFEFGEARVSEYTKTIPQFHPLSDKGATISQSPFWIGAPCGLDFSSEKRSKQKKIASNYEPTFQNGGTVSSYCAVRRSVTKPPGLTLRCPSPVAAVRAGHSCTEPVNNFRSRYPTPEMLACALFGMAAEILFSAWGGHTLKFSHRWFEIIRVSVPYIDMLMKSAPMPTICVVLTLAAFILGRMIGSTAERTKVSEVEKANAVIDENMMVKYKGGNELKTYAKGLKMPNESGNCGMVIPMKIEVSIGSSISNSFNGNSVNFVGFIAILAMFVMYI